MRSRGGLQPRYRPRYDCGDTQPAALGPKPPPAPHLVTMPALTLLVLAVAGAAAAVGEFVVSPLCPRPQLAIAKYARVPLVV